MLWKIEHTSSRESCFSWINQISFFKLYAQQPIIGFKPHLCVQLNLLWGLGENGNKLDICSTQKVTPIILFNKSCYGDNTIAELSNPYFKLHWFIVPNEGKWIMKISYYFFRRRKLARSFWFNFGKILNSLLYQNKV